MKAFNLSIACSLFCRYSESLYALLSIGGLYSFIHGANNTATLWFALSGAARSNGVLNAGYFGFQMMHRAYYAIFLKKCAFVSPFILHSFSHPLNLLLLTHKNFDFSTSLF